MKKLPRYKAEFINGLNKDVEVCYSHQVEILERKLEILERAIQTHRKNLYEYTSTPENTPDFYLYEELEKSNAIK